MGFKPGDEKHHESAARLGRLPLLHPPHRLRRQHAAHRRQRRHFGTEIESDSAGGRDPYTRSAPTMPTEGPLTDAGLEIWPRGIYDLVTQISREYNHPVIEITESGCGYLDTPYDGARAASPTPAASRLFHDELAELARAIPTAPRPLLPRLEPAR